MRLPVVSPSLLHFKLLGWGIFVSISTLRNHNFDITSSVFASVMHLSPGLVLVSLSINVDTRLLSDHAFSPGELEFIFLRHSLYRPLVAEKDHSNELQSPIVSRATRSLQRNTSRRHYHRCHCLIENATLKVRVCQSSSPNLYDTAPPFQVPPRRFLWSVGSSSRRNRRSWLWETPMRWITTCVWD